MKFNGEKLWENKEQEDRKLEICNTLFTYCSILFLQWLQDGERSLYFDDSDFLMNVRSKKNPTSQDRNKICLWNQLLQKVITLWK